MRLISLSHIYDNTHAKLYNYLLWYNMREWIIIINKKYEEDDDFLSVEVELDVINKLDLFIYFFFFKNYPNMLSFE